METSLKEPFSHNESVKERVKGKKCTILFARSSTYPSRNHARNLPIQRAWGVRAAGKKKECDWPLVVKSVRPGL